MGGKLSQAQGKPWAANIEIVRDLDTLLLDKINAGVDARRARIDEVARRREKHMVDIISPNHVALHTLSHMYFLLPEYARDTFGELWDEREEGEFEKVDSMFEWYQWIPTTYICSYDGSGHPNLSMESKYIPDLPPSQNTELYGAITQLLTTLLPAVANIVPKCDYGPDESRMSGQEILSQWCQEDEKLHVIVKCMDDDFVAPRDGPMSTEKHFEGSIRENIFAVALVYPRVDDCINPGKILLEPIDPETYFAKPACIPIDPNNAIVFENTVHHIENITFKINKRTHYNPNKTSVRRTLAFFFCAKAGKFVKQSYMKTEHHMFGKLDARLSYNWMPERYALECTADARNLVSDGLTLDEISPIYRNLSMAMNFANGQKALSQLKQQMVTATNTYPLNFGNLKDYLQFELEKSLIEWGIAVPSDIWDEICSFLLGKWRRQYEGEGQSHIATHLIACRAKEYQPKTSFEVNMDYLTP